MRNSYLKLIFPLELLSTSKQMILNIDINPEKKLFGTIWHGSIIIKTDSMSEFDDAVYANYKKKVLKI